MRHVQSQCHTGESLQFEDLELVVKCMVFAKIYQSKSAILDTRHMPGAKDSKMHKMTFLQSLKSSEGDRHIKRYNFIIIW